MLGCTRGTVATILIPNFWDGGGGGGGGTFSPAQASFFHLHISHNAPYLTSKFCITFVLHFSWVLQPSQEKLITMLMQNFGGQIRCIMGDVQVAYWKKYPQCSHSGEYRKRSSQTKLAKRKQDFKAKPMRNVEILWLNDNFIYQQLTLFALLLKPSNISPQTRLYQQLFRCQRKRQLCLHSAFIVYACRPISARTAIVIYIICFSPSALSFIHPVRVEPFIRLLVRFPFHASA